jgi:hypothetical protein
VRSGMGESSATGPCQWEHFIRSQFRLANWFGPLMSRPYHGHKNKQKSGIALEVSNECGQQVSAATAKCETDLAFVEFGTFRIDAACELNNPERQRGLKS